ncbi:MAG: hypothetical protein AAGJ82_13885 [Bacteroidota bacterium]
MSEFQQVVKEGAESVGRSVKRFFLWVFAIVIVLALLGVWGAGWTYSDGTRAGELVKITRKGVVFKTYEGQLNLGGFSSNDGGVVGNIWDFSTTNDEVYQQLQELEGKKVKLEYREVYKNMPWQGKTKYFIDKVELVK